MVVNSVIAADPVSLVLIAFAYLAIKHFVFDFVLQMPYQYQNKGIYGHPGGLIHAGQHVFGTALLFLVMTPSFRLGATILIAEFAVHYHIDWAKEQVMKRTGWQMDNAGYWWALGMDQLLHQLTYVAIVAALFGKFG